MVKVAVRVHLVHEVLEQVRERSVTQVVAQSRQLDQLDVARGNLQLRLRVADVSQHLLGKVRDADAMLEAIVRRSGEHEVRASELLQVAQPLELGSVQHAQQQWRQGDLPVDRVVHDLSVCARELALIVAGVHHFRLR